MVRIKIKRTGSMRRKINPSHPFKRNCPNMFKSHNEAIDRYMAECKTQRLIKQMHKTGMGPYVQVLR